MFPFAVIFDSVMAPLEDTNKPYPALPEKLFVPVTLTVAFVLLEVLLISTPSSPLPSAVMEFKVMVPSERIYNPFPEFPLKTFVPRICTVALVLLAVLEISTPPPLFPVEMTSNNETSPIALICNPSSALFVNLLFFTITEPVLSLLSM